MYPIKLSVFILITSINLYAISAIKIICDKDSEKIYLDGKLKTTCDKDDVIRLMVHKGHHTVDIRKKSEEARYRFTKKFFIGDGVQKLIEPDIKPIYTEYHYYKAVVENDDIDAYNAYLQNYPHGKYIRTMKEFQAYLKAKESFEQYKRYLHNYPHGKFLQKLQNYYRQNPLIATLQGHSKAVQALAMTKDSHYLFSGANDETIREWDLVNFTPLKKFTYAHNIGGGLTVSALALSPNEKRLLSNGRAFRLWDLRLETNSIIDKNFEPEEIYFYTPQTALTLRSSRLDIWDLQTQKRTFTYQGNNGYDAYMYGGAISSNKRYFYFGQYYDTFNKCGIVQFDIKNRKITRRFFSPFLRDEALCMALSPDGKYLITGTDNGANSASHNEHDMTLLMWDLQNGNVAYTLHQNGSVKAIAVDSQHHIFASGSSSGMIKLWDSDTGVPLGSFLAPAGINDLIFTKSGKKLIGALDDGTIRIWYMGFFSRQHGLKNLLKECQNGNIVACNNYLVYGGQNITQAKETILNQFKKILQKNGFNITYHNPTIYLYDRINSYIFFPLQNNQANNYIYLRIDALLSNDDKTYILIHAEGKNGSFSFTSPIYLIQNDKKQNYDQRMPSTNTLTLGSQDFVLVYKNFPLQNGHYEVVEGDNCRNCTLLQNGNIIKIVKEKK